MLRCGHVCVVNMWEMASDKTAQQGQRALARAGATWLKEKLEPSMK